MDVARQKAEASSIHVGRPSFSATLCAYRAARHDSAHHKLASTAVDQCRAASMHLHLRWCSLSTSIRRRVGHRQPAGLVSTLPPAPRRRGSGHRFSWHRLQTVRNGELHVSFRISFDEFIAQGASSGSSLLAQIEKRILGRSEILLAHRGVPTYGSDSQADAWRQLLCRFRRSPRRTRSRNHQMSFGHNNRREPTRVHRPLPPSAHAATFSRTASCDFVSKQRIRTAVAGLARSPASASSSLHGAPCSLTPGDSA